MNKEYLQLSDNLVKELAQQLGVKASEVFSWALYQVYLNVAIFLFTALVLGTIFICLCHYLAKYREEIGENNMEPLYFIPIPVVTCFVIVLIIAIKGIAALFNPNLEALNILLEMIPHGK